MCAWYRGLPDPEKSGVKATGIPGLYCDNRAAPSPNKGIGTRTRRTPEKKAKWRAVRATNVQARALINSEFKGEIGSRRSTEYHARLFALSQGTTG